MISQADDCARGRKLLMVLACPSEMSENERGLTVEPSSAVLLLSLHLAPNEVECVDMSGDVSQSV